MDTVNIPREIAQKVLDAAPMYAYRDGDGDVWTLRLSGEQMQHLRELVAACQQAMSEATDPAAVARARP